MRLLSGKLAISLLLIMFFTGKSYAAFDLTGMVKIFPDAPNGTPITAVADFAAGTMSVDPFDFLGTQITVVSGEILTPGRYTRSNTNSTSTHSRSVTIAPGNLGGYFVMSINGETFAVFMQWEVVVELQTYTNIPFYANTIRQSELSGKDLTIDFDLVEQGLFVHPFVSIQGGDTHECTETGGTNVSFSVTANMNASATLANVDWVLDGTVVGTPDEIINLFIGLGPHTIEAIATTNEGASETSPPVTFSVVDTTHPTAGIEFLNSLGQAVTSAIDGDIEIILTTTDICDAAPTIQASASPAMNVSNHDLIHIIQQNNNVILPTSAVNVSATSLDASGNSNQASAILIINN